MEPVKIIPCLDIKDGRVVKGVHFTELRDAGDPVEAARAYAADGADEIAFLDITATIEKRKTVFDVLSRVTRAVSVPLTLGGGLQSLDDMEKAFAAGAARISLSSAAFRRPELVAAAADRFGGGRIVVAIDADVNEACQSGREVYIDGGRTATGRDVADFAAAMGKLNVAAILATSRKTDGVRSGYDLELTRIAARAGGVPVIASGGAGKLHHFLEAVTEGQAGAVLAASVFHFGVFTVGQVREYLRRHGIKVAGGKR